MTTRVANTWAQSRTWIMDFAIFVDVGLLSTRLTHFYATAPDGSQTVQFCAQRDPLGKRITFEKKSTTFIKNQKSWSIRKSKKYFGRDQKFSIFFDLKNFENFH